MKNLRQNFSRGLVLLTLWALGSVAQAQLAVPAPPQLAASSYLLMDADSGEVLVEQNADEMLPPASLTKMMTTYVADRELASNNIRMSDQVTVSEKAWRMKGSLMFLEVGDQVSVEDLLKGIIIVSGNDASVALAEHVAGSEDAFADLMNATARDLGMNNSHFVNSTGWPADDHYSSARDLAVLARHIIKDFPEQYGIYAEKYFQYGLNKSTGKPLAPQPNRNRLLWRVKGVDGLKTGHTDAAGYCLVASAERDGRRLISVVMGTKSDQARAAESQKLITYGFRFFDNVTVKPGHQSLADVTVWKGAADQVAAGLAEDLIVTIPRGQQKKLSAALSLDAQIEAPIAVGQQLGSVKVRLDDQVIREVPLLALEAVEEGGFMTRIWHSIKLFFLGLLG